MRHVSQPAFLGFPRLSTLLEEVGRADHGQLPVIWLCPVVDDAPILNSSLGTSTQALVAQALLDGGVIGYCRMLVGRFQTNAGRALDAGDSARVERRLADLHAIVADRILSDGFRLVRATFATPRDYVFLRGEADMARYDADADTYLPSTPDGGELPP